MTDTIKAVARAIKAEWDRQCVAEDEAQGYYDYEPRWWEEWIPEAQAAIASHTKALIEGAGEVEHNLIASTAQRTFGGDHCFASVALLQEAATTIAALRTEIGQAKLDGVRAGIDASALLLERDDGFGEWWDAAQFVRSELDAEAIAKGKGDEGPCTDCWDTGMTDQTERPCSCDAGEPYRASALSDLIAGDADLYATKGDSDGDDGA